MWMRIITEWFECGAVVEVEGVGRVRQWSGLEDLLLMQVSLKGSGDNGDEKGNHGVL